MARLLKWVSPRTGEVKRIYIERHGLRNKLWLERIGPGMQVRFYGDEADFTAGKSESEPAHVREARAALAELGLDFERNSWDEIVSQAAGEMVK